VIISPPGVKVFGPKATLDTLNQVFTQTIVLQNLDSDKTVTIGLSNPNPSLLRFEPEQVEIKLRIEKFTESSIEIPIDFSNIKQNIQSFPSTVKVYFKVAQKDFNNVQAGGFNVKPELSGIKLQDVDRLHLILTKKPEFVRNERIVPANVEFLITK
jgi:YbbR domain-containing protein